MRAWHSFFVPSKESAPYSFTVACGLPDIRKRARMVWNRARTVIFIKKGFYSPSVFQSKRDQIRLVTAEVQIFPCYKLLQRKHHFSRKDTGFILAVEVPVIFFN